MQFVFIPASIPHYNSRQPSAFPSNYVGPRERHLAAMAEAQSAKARYVSALAKEEAAQRQLALFREQAYIDKLYAQEAAHRLRSSYYPTPYFDHYDMVDYHLNEPIFDYDVDLDSRVHREVHLRQLEAARRFALHREAEERKQEQLEILRKRLQVRDAIRAREQAKEKDAVEELVKLAMFGGSSDKSAPRCGFRGHCKDLQQCEATKGSSEPAPRSISIRGRPRYGCVNREQQCESPAKATSSSAQRTPEPSQPTSASAQPASKARANDEGKAKVDAQVHDDANVRMNPLHALLSAFLNPTERPAPSEETSKSGVPSLKEQLEARLYSDPDVEIRDTLQALLSSVFAPHPTSTPTPTPTPEAHEEDSASGKGKGKGKAVSFNIPASNPSSSDVSHSLDSIANIEAAFFSLESDFVFPKALDPTAEALSLTADSDSDSTISLERRLAYTARNAPVRYYEHALSALLGQLDAIESSGSERVRERRKEVVGRVEKALEEVEREVELRLAKPKADAPSPTVSAEATSSPVAEEPAVAPSASEAVLDTQHVAEPVAVVVGKEIEEEPVAVEDAPINVTATPDDSDITPNPSAIVGVSAGEADDTNFNEASPLVDVEEAEGVILHEEEQVAEPIRESDVLSPLTDVDSLRCPPPCDNSVVGSPSDVSEPETMDTFLLPAESSLPSEAVRHKDAVEHGSDASSEEDTWLEI